MEIATPLSVEVCDLAARANERSSTVAFQSTLAAAAKAVQRALSSEERAAQAAISLAQCDALGGMTEQLRAVEAAFQSSLDTKGRCLMPHGEKEGRRPFRFRRRERAAAPSAGRSTWWFSLTEAIEALEEGRQRMKALASGQPEGAPSRVLSEATAELLREHHDRLVDEADRWIG